MINGTIFSSFFSEKNDREIKYDINLHVWKKETE